MSESVKYLLGLAGPSGYGSKSTAEYVVEACPYLNSITAIVTGATSGIGKETARVLAMRGVRLVLPARNLTAAKEVKAGISVESPWAEIIVLHLDLSSLSSVRCFVSEFLALQLPLHLLINNAGIFPAKHALSEDGLELTFATNYLGHFLLTKLLLEKMVETARVTRIQSRIVNVSSCSHENYLCDGIRYLDLVTRNKIPFHSERAYVLSKRANVLHSMELGKRLKEVEANVTSNSLHPGIVWTKITRDKFGFVSDVIFFLTSKFLKSIQQAAATTCYVATHPGLVGVSGKYFVDCNEAPSSALDSQAAKALWDASEAMVAGEMTHQIGFGSKILPEEVGFESKVLPGME